MNQLIRVAISSFFFVSLQCQANISFKLTADDGSIFGNGVLATPLALSDGVYSTYGVDGPVASIRIALPPFLFDSKTINPIPFYTSGLSLSVAVANGVPTTINGSFYFLRDDYFTEEGKLTISDNTYSYYYRDETSGRPPQFSYQSQGSANIVAFDQILAVPEPTSVALMLAGLATILLWSRFIALNGKTDAPSKSISQLSVA